MIKDWQTALERGHLQIATGNKEAAKRSYLEVLAQIPDQYEAHEQLAQIAHQSLDFRQELYHIQACFKARPLDSPHLLQRQLALMGYTGQSHEIPATCAFALRATPEGKNWFEQMSPEKKQALLAEDIYNHSKLISHLYSQYAIRDQELFAQLKLWAQIHTLCSTPIAPFGELAALPLPLKVGYISNEFDSHSPIQIFLPLLAHHNQTEFELHAFSDVRHPDQRTVEIQRYFKYWHETRTLSNQALFKYIRQLGIHILVDLGGLNHRIRLPLFGMRAAPVQMTGLGFLFSTGVPTMDGIFVDQVICPPEKTSLYQEPPYYLSTVFHWKPRESYPIEPLPYLEKGCITFGSANSLNKFCPELLDTWAEILKQMPHAVLCLKTPALNDKGTKNWLKEAFQARGISSQRLILWGRKPDENHLTYFYSKIDIALDTFPYTGAITTCDALWMGVPVVTLYEPEISSRALSSSILKQVSREQWIASSRKNYIKIALELAQDPFYLVEQRQVLRKTLLHSAICDGPAFAQEVEAIYQTVWKKRWAEIKGSQ